MDYLKLESGMKAGAFKVTIQKQHPNSQTPQRHVPGSEPVLKEVSEGALFLSVPLQHHAEKPAVLDRLDSGFSFRELRAAENIGP